MNRDERRQVAVENEQYYRAHPELKPAAAVVTPSELPPLGPASSPVATAVTVEARSVVEVMTREARRRPDGPDGRVGVMVFASATKPGGGWRNGSLAQEEAISYASLLPFSLESVDTEFYAPSRTDKNSYFYTSRGVYSPAVPIIRDDAGRWLDDRPRVDFFTVAAPNIGAMKQNLHAVDRPRVATDLRVKMRNTLRAFGEHGCTTLVLGAFGCGVFANDPTVVAGLWHDLLADPEFGNRYAKVIFAVPDPGSPNHQAFAHLWS
ncbi:MAG: TIGR02452 family protein [Micrococcales bacterium]|nr:TIGR02452 family protein [Micrococcales bacterium]